MKAQAVGNAPGAAMSRAGPGEGGGQAGGTKRKAAETDAGPRVQRPRLGGTVLIGGFALLSSQVHVLLEPPQPPPPPQKKLGAGLSSLCHMFLCFVATCVVEIVTPILPAASPALPPSPFC